MFVSGFKNIRNMFGKGKTEAKWERGRTSVVTVAIGERRTRASIRKERREGRKNLLHNRLWLTAILVLSFLPIIIVPLGIYFNMRQKELTTSYQRIAIYQTYLRGELDIKEGGFRGLYDDIKNTQRGFKFWAEGDPRGIIRGEVDNYVDDLVRRDYISADRRWRAIIHFVNLYRNELITQREKGELEEKEARWNYEYVTDYMEQGFSRLGMLDQYYASMGINGDHTERFADARHWSQEGLVRGAPEVRGNDITFNVGLSGFSDSANNEHGIVLNLGTPRQMLKAGEEFVFGIRLSEKDAEKLVGRFIEVYAFSEDGKKYKIGGEARVSFDYEPDNVRARDLFAGKVVTFRVKPEVSLFSEFDPNKVVKFYIEIDSGIALPADMKLIISNPRIQRRPSLYQPIEYSPIDTTPSRKRLQEMREIELLAPTDMLSIRRTVSPGEEFQLAGDKSTNVWFADVRLPLSEQQMADTDLRNNKISATITLPAFDRKTTLRGRFVIVDNDGHIFMTTNQAIYVGKSPVTVTVEGYLYTTAGTSNAAIIPRGWVDPRGVDLADINTGEMRLNLEAPNDATFRQGGIKVEVREVRGEPVTVGARAELTLPETGKATPATREAVRGMLKDSAPVGVNTLGRSYGWNLGANYKGYNDNDYYHMGFSAVDVPENKAKSPTATMNDYKAFLQQATALALTQGKDKIVVRDFLFGNFSNGTVRVEKGKLKFGDPHVKEDFIARLEAIKAVEADLEAKNTPVQFISITSLIDYLGVEEHPEFFTDETLRNQLIDLMMELLEIAHGKEYSDLFARTLWEPINETLNADTINPSNINHIVQFLADFASRARTRFPDVKLNLALRSSPQDIETLKVLFPYYDRLGFHYWKFMETLPNQYLLRLDINAFGVPAYYDEADVTATSDILRVLLNKSGGHILLWRAEDTNPNNDDGYERSLQQLKKKIRSITKPKPVLKPKKVSKARVKAREAMEERVSSLKTPIGIKTRVASLSRQSQTLESRLNLVRFQGKARGREFVRMEESRLRRQIKNLNEEIAMLDARLMYLEPFTHAFDGVSGFKAAPIAGITSALSLLGGALQYFLQGDFTGVTLTAIIVGLYFGWATARYFLVGKAVQNAFIAEGYTPEAAKIAKIADSAGYRHPAFERLSPRVCRIIDGHEAFRTHTIGMLAMLPVVRAFVKTGVTDIMKMSREERLRVAENPTDRYVEYNYVRRHVERVSRVAQLIGRQIGLPQNLMNILMAAAETHDAEYVDPDVYGAVEDYHGGKKLSTEDRQKYPTVEEFLTHLREGKGDDLTSAEESVARDLYNHGARAVYDIKTLGIAMPLEVELLIRYHQFPSEFYRDVDTFRDRLSIPVEDLALLLTTLFTADVFENGNNVDKMQMFRGGRPAETFDQTFGFFEKIYGKENIQDNRAREALAALIGRRDTELLSVVADSRHTSELMPQDLEFIQAQKRGPPTIGGAALGLLLILTGFIYNLFTGTQVPIEGPKVLAGYADQIQILPIWLQLSILTIVAIVAFKLFPKPLFFAMSDAGGIGGGGPIQPGGAEPTGPQEDRKEPAEEAPKLEITDIGTVGVHRMSYRDQNTRTRIHEDIDAGERFTIVDYEKGEFTHKEKGDKASSVDPPLMSKILALTNSERMKSFLEKNKSDIENLRIYLLEAEEGSREAMHPHFLTIRGKHYEFATSGTHEGREQAIYLTRALFTDLNTRLLVDILMNQITLAIARHKAWHTSQPFPFGNINSRKSSNIVDRIVLLKTDKLNPKAELAELEKYDMRLSEKYAIDREIGGQVVRLMGMIKDRMPDFAPAVTNHDKAVDFKNALEAYDIKGALYYWGLLTYEFRELALNDDEKSKRLLRLPAARIFVNLAQGVNEMVNQYIFDEGLRNQDGQEFGHAVGRVVVISDVDKIDEEFAKSNENEIWVIPYLPTQPPRIPGVGVIVSVQGGRNATDTVKGQGVPVAVIPNAVELLKGLNQYECMLKVEEDRDVELRLSFSGEEGVPRQEIDVDVVLPKAVIGEKDIYKLSEVDENFISFVGAKAANVGKVMDSGMKVPEGLALAFSFWQKFKAHNDLEGKIAAIRKSIKTEDRKVLTKKEELHAYLEEIKNLIINGEFPEDLKDELFTHINEMRERHGHVGFYVRSSFNFEDLTEKVMAGHYDSYPIKEIFPNTSTDENILKAIKMVFASMWNEIAFTARVEADIKDEDVLPGVIVEVPVKAKFAGTMYTANTYSYSFNEMSIMASHGQGAAVVDERGKPAEVIVNKITGEIKVLHRESWIDTEHHIVDGELEGRYVSIEDRQTEILTPELVERLRVIGEQIEALYQYRPQDIEWLVDYDDNIWIVQTRPMYVEIPPTVKRPERQVFLPAEKMIDDEILKHLGIIDEATLNALRAAKDKRNVDFLISYLHLDRDSDATMLTIPGNPLQSEKIVAARYLESLGEDVSLMETVTLDAVNQLIDYIKRRQDNLTDPTSMPHILNFLYNVGELSKDGTIKSTVKKFFLYLGTMATLPYPHSVNLEMAKALVSYGDYDAALKKLRDARVAAKNPDTANTTIALLSIIPTDEALERLEAFAISENAPAWVREYALRSIDKLRAKIAKMPVPKVTPKILLGIPYGTDLSQVKEVEEIIAQYDDKVGVLILRSADEDKNLKQLADLAKERNIEFVARLDVSNVKDINTVVNTFVTQIDRDRFSLVYAQLAGLSREDVEAKDVSELQDILSIVTGEFLSLRADSIDERIAKGEYWQLRALVADNTILGMEGLLSEIKQIDEPHAAVVSNVMIESDASVLAKVKAKRLHKGLKPIKDVLTIFNPEITRESVDVYLSELGAEGVFDEVILYSELEAKEGKIDENNIVRVVKSVVEEKLNLDEEHIVLVGGEVYFREIAGMVVAILTGDIDKYIDELSKFLERYGSAYEEALIGIYTKDEALLEKLRQKRTLKEESESYKEYIEDYRRFIKEVITKL